MKIKAFIEHKLAEHYSDCQDFFYINAEERAVAVSDGMSQSIFPDLWAEELTTKFAKNKQWNASKEQIRASQDEWKKHVENFVKRKECEGKDPWMLKNSLIEKRGAGATFCGIRFNGKEWNGIVLGDTSLIEVGTDNRISNFCTTNQDGFGNHPDYFDSMTCGKGEPKKISGKLKKNCKLLIVTDPIAEFLWLMSKEGKEADYISQLLTLNSHDDFCVLVERWRKDEHMHNDDSTLVCIESNKKDKFEIIVQDSLKELRKKEMDDSMSMETFSQKEPIQQIQQEKSHSPNLMEIIKRILSICSLEKKSPSDKIHEIKNFLKNFKNV